MAKEKSGGKFPHLENSMDKGEKEEKPNKMRRKEMRKRKKENRKIRK